MLRREVDLLARDIQDFRTAGRGRGTPRRTRTSRCIIGTTTNLVAATPDIGNLPAGGTNRAHGRPIPPPPPDLSTAPRLLPESVDYIVLIVLMQTLDSQLAWNTRRLVVI